MPTPQQISRINDVLHQIHKDITAELSGKNLAIVAAYSEQHLHKVFTEVVGESLHQYIRRCRLETAANQLMFNQLTPVIEVAEKCGFQSLSSFSKAFKSTFECTPGQWRQKKSINKKSYLEDKEIAAAYERIQKQPLPVATLTELPSRQVAYVRHKGYGRDIRRSWQLLAAWAAAEEAPVSPAALQIGLHHSNPSQVELSRCRYVACVEIDRPLTKRSLINQMIIPGGLHACFEFTGRYGELLPWISKVTDEWLPASGLVAKTTPAFVEYQKNHFLSQDEQFELCFCLPVGFY